jgi:hypothetical protein
MGSSLENKLLTVERGRKNDEAISFKAGCQGIWIEASSE